MTMPLGDDPGGVLAQVLIKLGELASDVAVVKDRLSVVADHEQRIREVERWKLQQEGETAGTRDFWSRIIAGLALLAAAGSAAAQYLHP